MNNEPGKGLAVASLVLGILSLVFMFFSFIGWLGTILGIIGIILAVVAKQQGAKGGMVTAGLVLSIIGAALSLVLYIACVACVNNALNTLGNPYNYLY